jgi:serine/threonine protein kinase
VAIKDSVYGSIAEANASIKEAMVMATMHHPAICRVFECFLEQCDEGYKVVLVVELMEMDLAAEIAHRAISQNYWSEEELMVMLKTIVSGLCAAKQKGIAHRDIKPQNLFISGDTIKIGDFGSSAFDLMSQYQRMTLQGTPYFLSPELKGKYARILLQESDTTEYDPFQSDVYSLGLSMVYVALLHAPDEMGHIQNLAEKTTNVLRKLDKYPTLRNYLQKMLEIDPYCRVSLDELQEKLTAYLSTSQNGPVEAEMEQPAPPLYGGNQVCPGCQTICKLDSVPLACNHYFHSSDCLYRFLRAQTQGFTLGNDPKCPICFAPISQEHLCTVFGSEKYETMVASEYLSKCCVCHQREVKISYKKCKHLCCNECQLTFFAMSICPICSKLARFVKLGANSA